MIYSTRLYPIPWTTDVTVHIQNEDTRKPGNYRGIMFTCTISKLFTYVLDRRVCLWSEEYNILSEAQFAYKPGVDTVDTIHIYMY